MSKGRLRFASIAIGSVESFGEAEKAINTAIRTGRFFEREVNFGLKLLQTVRLDLEDVAAIVQSGKKQTNHHRALIQQLNKGIIPKSEVQGSQLLLCSCLGDRPCPESEAADKGQLVELAGVIIGRDRCGRGGL